MRHVWIPLLAPLAALLITATATNADEPPELQTPTSEKAALPAEEQADQLELLRQKTAELDRLQTEVDALRAATHTPTMIVVNVEMLEVSLTKMRKLGFDFKLDGLLIVRAVTPPDPTASGPQDRSIAGFLKALKENNIAKTLAEPTLATTSGRPASIHVGGQFPLPASTGAANSVAFQRWGTELDVVAEALGNGKVRLQIKSWIGEPNDEHAIEVAGQKIPSLRSKQCNTTCETVFGETVVLGGLLENRVESQLRDGEFVEQTNEVELLTVVRVEDANRVTRAATPQRTATAAPKASTRRPTPHDSVRR